MLNYADDVDCKDCFSVLNSDQNAGIVDVRTTREWETIGIPDLSDLPNKIADKPKPIFVEWQIFPEMNVNPDFTSQVQTALNERGIGKDDPIYFLCRSGVRSKSAAAAITAIGYLKAYNILHGFEGAPNEAGERSTINGWVHDGLPWKKE